MSNIIMCVTCRFPNTNPVLLNVLENPKLAESMVGGHDVVISLLPYVMHHEVAKLAIATKTDMVTASYCTPQMKGLHEAAQNAGITVLNEVTKALNTRLDF